LCLCGRATRSLIQFTRANVVTTTMDVLTPGGPAYTGPAAALLPYVDYFLPDG